MAELERIRERYRRFADDECQGYSDAYFRLAHEIAGDEWLPGFLAQMPETQPNLFLGVLRFLSGPDAMPESGAAAREFVQAREEEVALLMRVRRTQTNEPGRCASILPALPPGPLALLEVGASAGLCLLMDRYSYDYDGVSTGAQGSPVHLRCRVSGAPPIPNPTPSIVWRAGLDLNPLDVRDPRDAKWLLSLVWPEHEERRQRLSAAIEIARTCDLRLHRGDATKDLPGLVDEAPQDATLVVFHTAALVYADSAGVRAFADHLTALSRTRDIVWISNESAGVIPEITALAPPAQPSQKLLGRTRLRCGSRHDELLGVTHLHGAELDWVPSAPS